MKDAFDQINPRHALALSGEFNPQCDPESKPHTLGFLMMATLERGDRTIRDGVSYYKPPWAPIESEFYNETNRGPALVIVGWRRSAEVIVSFSDIGIHLSVEGIGKPNEVFCAEKVEDCVSAKASIADRMGSYFSKFDGWVKDGDIWVPPTPEVDEQAAGSAG